MIFQKQAEDWKNQITGITVNGIAYEKGQNSYSLEENQWYVEPYQNVVKFNCTAMEKGENTIVIYADGYEDLTLTIAVNEAGEGSLVEEV